MLDLGIERSYGGRLGGRQGEGKEKEEERQAGGKDEEEEKHESEMKLSLNADEQRLGRRGDKGR